jgi:hypothetical protein
MCDPTTAALSELPVAGGMAQVVEHLPGKHKDVTANPSTAKNNNKRIPFSQVLVAHACNPSYSGGRDLED